MKNLALKRIQKMKTYSPPLDGRSNYGGLLLDFNERTTSPSVNVADTLWQYSSKKTQLYPEYFDLEKQIARYAKVGDSQVMITNGTDQAIDIIFRTFCDREDTVMIPEPSFAMYNQYAQIIGSNIISPLYSKDTMEFPLQDVLEMIDNKIKMIVVCNPNNPTGTLLPVADIEQIARKAKEAIVYVDEAYFEFSEVTASGLIDKYPNVIVSRTFSKAFGLAGLRIGYVLANSDYIAEMLKVRGPYDVNQLGYQAATAALVDTEDVRIYRDEVMNIAKPLIEIFFKQNHITFYPSSGNFILFKPDNSEIVADKLRQNGIALRPQDKVNIQGTLRLTIGTEAQMKTFVDIYKKVIIGSPKQKYAFLDRDGTLIFEPQDDFQVDSLKKLKLLDGVIEGLQSLQNKDYRLVIVSNQDGAGTPSFPRAGFEAPHNAMLEKFKASGINFDQVFICVHLKEDNCGCRKPKTGLLDDWLEGVTIDSDESFVCGDRENDKNLAKNLGLKFVPMTTNDNFLMAITEEILL